MRYSIRIVTSFLAAIGGCAIFAAATSPDSITLRATHHPKRFDYLIREDFFAGFRGDSVAFRRAMKLCEDTLVINPTYPEALVWHGSGVWFLSGKAFQTGDVAHGMALSDSGLREMDRAVALAPEDLGAIIPRGASLLAAAPYIPGPFGKMLLAKGAGDYEKTLALEREYFPKLSVHARGELLGGLATAYRAMGDTAKAREFFGRLESEVPNSEYANIAKRWLQTSMTLNRDTPPPPTCIGCHTDEE